MPLYKPDAEDSRTHHLGMPTALISLYLLGSMGLLSAAPASDVPTPEDRDPGVPQAVLEAEARRFAGAWVEGDVPAIEGMLVEDGIRLHIEGDLFPSVNLRRATEAIEAFLEKYPGGEVELVRVSQNAGDEATGFAELRWHTSISGRNEPVIFTVFVAYGMDDGAWAITEIRILS